MTGQEIQIRQSLFEEEPMNGQRHGDVGARTNGQVDVGLARQRCRAWIHDDQPRTLAPRRSNPRHEMNS